MASDWVNKQTADISRFADSRMIRKKVWCFSLLSSKLSSSTPTPSPPTSPPSPNSASDSRLATAMATSLATRNERIRASNAVRNRLFDSNVLISNITMVICLDDYHSLDRTWRKKKEVMTLDPRANGFDLPRF